jgi:N-dimethylarginine dimethylaminohydrolase
MPTKINRRVLMSGADYFDDQQAINAHMDSGVRVDVERAKTDHQNIRSALEQAGVEVVCVDPPAGCQDGVYTANWALCIDGKAVLSRLPNVRKGEEPHARRILKGLGFEILEVPDSLKFSGQGDALVCGEYLFVGSQYRTDKAVHEFLGQVFDKRIVGIQTVPQTDTNQSEQINPVTGWPDSYFYDLDLALAVLRDDLIAWCPDAFLPASQDKIRDLAIGKIEVTLEEAKNGLACNLVSTGETVVMSSSAPILSAQIEAHGLGVVTPDVHELQKGGGFIRCTTLTLD